jgi:arylsulfatase A-like enzyme
VTDWTSITGTETGDNDVAHLRSPTGWLKTGISSAEIALPKLLADAGYRTIHAGKAHFGSQGAFGQYPQAVGFDVNIAGNEIGHPASYYGSSNFGTGSNHVSGLEAYHGQNIFLTEALTLEMNKALAKSVADGAPFFAYMAQYAVHSPFNEDARFAGNYPSLSGSERAYATLIEGMDKSLGDIRAKLNALGVAENTLIVFMSDNGGDAPLANNNANPVISGNAPLRGKKGMRYEGGIRVPMIVAWAKSAAGNPFQVALPIPAGSRQADLVHVSDLFPTLLGAAAVPFGHAVDGHDLRPYLTATPGFRRPQSLVTHFPHGHNNDHFSVYHEGDWKLIFNYAAESSELYNLASDLGEQANLAASQPARVMTMSRALARQLAVKGAQFSQNLTTAAPQPPRTPAHASVDADGDGIPDLTEDPNRNGLVDPGETDPDASDTDADGTGDGAEAAIGTSPLNPASYFQLRAISQPGGSLQLTWPSQPGNRFDIRFSPDLTDWSTLLESGFPAINPGTTTHYSPPPSATPCGFYRVELK